jgi:hypothetical protein
MNENSDEIKNQEIKPKEYKRNFTDEQRQKQKEHLQNIRELAMKKKLELKEITLKSKLAKCIPKQAKQELAKQYDQYIENKVKEKTKPKKEDEEVEEVIVKKSKPKTKKKKIVYVEESESESEEEVIVRKPKPKPKPEPLEHLVYNNTKDQLYQRMIEERVKASIIGYSAALGN